MSKELDELYDKLLVAVYEAFEVLSGDPTDAINAAKKFAVYDDSVQRWINSGASKAAKVAWVYLIPFKHLLVMIGDVAFVFHTMGVCAWGVGHLLGCSVEGKPDLQVVLGLWSGAIPKDEIENRLRNAVQAGHIVFSPDGVAHAQESLANYLVKDYSLPIAPVVIPIEKFKGKMAQKVATKIANKLLPKFAAKAIIGFASIIGVFAIAWINRRFVQSFGQHAEVYYQGKRRLRQTTD